MSLIEAAKALLETLCEDDHERIDCAARYPAGPCSCGYDDLLAKRIEALRVALTEAPALPGREIAEEWRPIEDAPRDGTEVLAWCVHANAEWSDDPVAHGWAGPVIARWIDHNGGGWTWHGLAGAFTHFRPLPPPPKPEVEG